MSRGSQNLDPVIDLPGEVWRPVPGFSRYEASSEGRVRSSARRGPTAGLTVPAPRLMTPRASRRTGYWQVTLVGDDGRKKTWLLHRLVLFAHIGEQPNEATWSASHMNGDKADNRLVNISYEPLRINILRNDSTARKPHRPKRFLTADVVRAIRADAASMTRAALAAKYGISAVQAHRIATRQAWAKVA